LAGRFRFGEYLGNVVRDRNLRPRDAPGVYVVSERSWKLLPNREAGILYVGQAQYLRYRIGQLLPDLFGFTSDDRADREAYEHRGGHSLWHRYCVEAGLEPLNLFLAWRARSECLDCTEANLRELMSIEWTPVRRACTANPANTIRAGYRSYRNGHLRSARSPALFPRQRR